MPGKEAKKIARAIERRQPQWQHSVCVHIITSRKQARVMYTPLNPTFI